MTSTTSKHIMTSPITKDMEVAFALYEYYVELGDLTEDANLDDMIDISTIETAYKNKPHSSKTMS